MQNQTYSRRNWKRIELLFKRKLKSVLCIRLKITLLLVDWSLLGSLLQALGAKTPNALSLNYSYSIQFNSVNVFYIVA